MPGNMQKTVTHFLLALILAGVFVSCKKTSLPPPPSTGHGGEAEIPPVVETDPAVLTPKPNVHLSLDINGYYEALPAKYHETTQQYPVIFLFHGGGQYGDGSTYLDTLLSDGIARLLRDKKFPPSFTVPAGTFSFIVIMPQLKKAVQTWEVDSLVNYTLRNYRIDSSRIYFSGFSLGGRQATDYAAYKPKLIAAVTAMAGMPQMTSSLDGKCKAIADANLPVWQFHAKNDSAWKYTESEKFVNTINYHNPQLLDTGHGSGLQRRR